MEVDYLFHSIKMKFLNLAQIPVNYTCQCCGIKANGKINAHHIYNYSEYEYLRTNIDNGITLCESCHTEFHKKYGRINNNPEQILKFIQLKRNELSQKISKTEQKRRFKVSVLKRLEKLKNHVQMKLVLI